MHVGVLAPSDALEALEELITAYRSAGHRVTPWPLPSSPPGAAELADRAGAVDALLVVGDRRRSPRTALPGPVVEDDTGRPVPVSWVPDLGTAAVRRFARAAARVHGRNGSRPVAVLSQWHPRYLRLAGRIDRLLTEGDDGLPSFVWTSDVMTREDLLEGMGQGLASAIYVGHGRPVGWVGYRGLRRHHTEAIRGEPIGVLLSICCVTASRRRVGLSFAESLPMDGVVGAAVGAVSDTLHTENTRLVVRFSRALRAGASDVSALVLAARVPSSESLSAYRILGDPIAPIAGAAGATTRAASVPRYP